MKKILKLFLLVAVLFLICLAACQNKSVPQIEIVARVGDLYLTRSQLQAWIPPDLPADQKDAITRRYVERWVQNSTLYLAALEEGVTLNSYQEWSLNLTRQEMLAQKYVDSKQPQNVVITDEEISTYYEKNKEEYKRDFDEVHLVQLYLEKLDKAIAQEIQGSKSLLEVITRNYLHTQRYSLLEPNGDLGYIPVNRLRKEIARRVRSGRTGRVYGPIKLGTGYYYFQMMDKQPAGSYRPLELVKEEIRTRLEIIKRQKLPEEIFKQVQKNYKAEIFSEHIN